MLLDMMGVYCQMVSPDCEIPVAEVLEWYSQFSTTAIILELTVVVEQEAHHFIVCV